MWLCLDAALVNGPHIYSNWAAVLRWLEMEFGPDARIKVDEIWPVLFAPDWFDQNMLPHEVETFVPVLLGDKLVGVVVEVDHLYGRHTQVGSRENCASFWERNRKRWVEEQEG